MQSSLIVKKNGDANFRPIKYRIVEMTVGGTLAATNCVLQTIEVGFDTEDNWRKWDVSRDTVGLQGTLGEFEVATLDTLSLYDVQTPTAGTDYGHRRNHI